MSRKSLRAKYLVYPMAVALFAGLTGCGPFDAGSDWNGQVYFTGDAAAIYNRCYGPEDQGFPGGIDHGNPGGYRDQDHGRSHDHGYDHGYDQGRDHDGRDHGGGIAYGGPRHEAAGGGEHIAAGASGATHAVASGGEEHGARGGTESASGPRR